MTTYSEIPPTTQATYLHSSSDQAFGHSTTSLREKPQVSYNDVCLWRPQTGENNISSSHDMHGIANNNAVIGRRGARGAIYNKKTQYDGLQSFEQSMASLYTRYPAGRKSSSCREP